MANYNMTCKVLRGNEGDVETTVEDYLNTIDDSKTIRNISMSRFGTDQLLVLIIHDA